MMASISSLVATTKENTKILGELTRATSKASAQSTSTLVGTAGGCVGMAVAYGLTFVLPVSFPIVGPMCSVFGIVLGIMINRGKSRNDIERKLEENTIAAEEIMRRIKSLPKNAPQGIRDELWSTYKALNSMQALLGQSTAALLPSTAQTAILAPPNKATVTAPVPSRTNGP